MSAWWVLAGIAVCSALVVSGASAQPGINLSWNDCGTAGVQNMEFACDTNAGGSPPVFELFASFDPSETRTDFVANEWVIDLESAGATLPDWWGFTGTNCRGSSMSMNTYFSNGPFTCADPWGGAVAIQGFGYTPGFSGPNTARIVGVQAMAGPIGRVDAGIEHYAFTLIINKARTTGTGACAGCEVPVCIVLNEISVIGIFGSLRETAPRDRNFVTWQGGAIAAPGCPLATPARSQTWGQVKSLYR